MLCCAQPQDQTQIDKQMLKERWKGRKRKGGRKAAACHRDTTEKQWHHLFSDSGGSTYLGRHSQNQVQGSARYYPRQIKASQGFDLSRPPALLCHLLYSCPLCPKPPEPKGQTLAGCWCSVIPTFTVGTVHRFRSRDPESTTRITYGAREHLTTAWNFSCHGGKGVTVSSTSWLKDRVLIPQWRTEELSGPKHQ